MHFKQLIALPLALSVVSAATISSTKTTTSASPSVTLDYCTVAAVAGNSSLGYYKYQNIRFAAVPTGNLRFAKPQWPPIEKIVNNGTLADSDVDCASDEDCLYMDVWAPANSAGKKLPVLVWTYGGGFTGGSKSQNTPEGLFNLTTEFVFVAYNYRLGLTGLATGPTYQHEGGISNLGLWDAEHAFKWTRKYISKFGGDPEQVTAVGFSAGGSNVMFQMTRFAGRAEQLFDRAYIMSPGYVPGAGHHHAEVFWQNVSSAVGCDGGHIDCVRGVNFTTLSTAATNMVSKYTYQFQPRVDGNFVADTYEAQLYQKQFNFAGPCVISHELHEANSVAYSGVNTTADVSTYLRIFFPAITDDVVAKLLALYPESDYTSPGLRFADMKQSFDLTAKNFALTEALNNETWNARVALGGATHGTDQDYYWYKTYTLSSSTSTSSGSTANIGGSASGSNSMGATGGSTSSGKTGTTSSASSGKAGATSSVSSAASASASSTSSNAGPGGASGASGAGAGAGAGSATSVNSTVAIKMQKYLMSFVLTGNPNTKWANDKLYWPKHSELKSSVGSELVLNTTFSIADDNLANNKSLYWNHALWY